MTVFSRRRFLQGTAALGVSLAAPAAWGARARPAPSSRITLACIGVNKQGTLDMRSLIAFPQVQLLAVCDVDDVNAANARGVAENWYARQSAAAGSKGIKTYRDFREVLARDDVDAVLIATPDHWHAAIAIAAAKAGKDIYCEKPVSLTIRQGRLMADAVKRYGVVFQTGSQQRSMQKFRTACELVRNGRLGKIQRVVCGVPPGTDLGIQPEQPVPPAFDYNFWLGPAPWAPYTAKRCHWNYRYILDYSAGTVTDWGAHHFDIAQWALGTEDTGPVEIQGKGEFPREGLSTAPINFHVEYTYASGVKVIGTTSADRGVRFEGSQGWVFVSREKIEANPASLLSEVIGPGETRLYRSGDHHGDFLRAVRSRTQPVAPVEVAHRSATVCHLGTIAMLLQRPVKWDPRKELFVGDPEADRMIDRAPREPWSM